MSPQQIAEVARQARRGEVIARRIQLCEGPPAWFGHEFALEVIPTGDVNLMIVYANQVEPLQLVQQLPGTRQREDGLPHPDQWADLEVTQPALLSQLSAERGRIRLARRGAPARGDPDVAGERLIREGLEEQGATLPIDDDGTHRLPSYRYFDIRFWRHLGAVSAGMISRAKVRIAGTKSSGRFPK